MIRQYLVNEAEVIGGFLQNEFYQPEFHPDRAVFEPVVLQPNFQDAAHNALRRALLFRRRGHLWRQLPADVQWYEGALEAADLRRLRVFPRLPWQLLPTRELLLQDVAARIRHRELRGRKLISKVQSLSYQLRNSLPRTTVVMIGTDDHAPLTVLEGNHRLVAALLACTNGSGSGESIATLLNARFRIFGGFSTRMVECCWYRNTLPNLLRYGWMRVQALAGEPETAPVPEFVDQAAAADQQGPATLAPTDSADDAHLASTGCSDPATSL